MNSSFPAFRPFALGLALCFLILFGAFSPPAQAGDTARARALARDGVILPLEDILDRARDIKPGRVIDIDLDRDDGRYIYEIEILDKQGRVWELEFNASTGELYKLELDD